MILKYISIPETNFSSSWKIGWGKIQKLSKFDRLMTLFWLLGPFIYLIERSPADIWLTFLGLCFLFKCFKNSNWYWLNQWWSKCVIIFWIIAVFSSVISPDPEFSIGRALAWIRFPLYAAAAQVWLAKDKEIRFLMIISLLIGSIIMMVFISFEFFYDPAYGFNPNPKGRLLGPYGDLVPGGYFGKVCLPLFCFSVALINSKKTFISILCIIFSILILSHTIMTGERGHVLILFCSGIVSLIVWRFNFSKSLIMLVLISLVFFAYFNTYGSHLTSRFTNSFISSVPFAFTKENPYWGAWRSGIQQGLSTPIIGIGANGTRKTCEKLPLHWLPGKNYCGGHPHNFYIQLFAETGLIGLFFGILMFFSILKTCWDARNKKDPKLTEYIAFVIPLAVFFPIQNHGNFFGQWGNLFLWFGLALAIAENQKWQIKKLT